MDNHILSNLSNTLKLSNNGFNWSGEAFREWADSRKRLIMEDFYREGRQRFNILMDGKKPIGGRWNFDRENRKPPKGKLTLPEALWFEPDEIVQAIIDWLKHSPAFKNSQAYWQIEPFRWGVTRSRQNSRLQTTHRSPAQRSDRPRRSHPYSPYFLPGTAQSK